MKCSEAEVGRGEWRTHHIESKSGSFFAYRKL